MSTEIPDIHEFDELHILHDIYLPVSGLFSMFVSSCELPHVIFFFPPSKAT